MSSYWIVRNLLLAGAYPGDPDPVEHRRKVQALVSSSVRLFVNLMEEGERFRQDTQSKYTPVRLPPYREVERIREFNRPASMPPKCWD